MIATMLVAAPGAASQGRKAPVARIARTTLESFDSRDTGSVVGVSGRIAQARTALAGTLGKQAVVAADPATGSIRFLGRLDGYLTGPSARSAESIAMGYVRAHRAAFGLSAADLSTFVLRQDYVDLVGTHHLSWVQRAGGIQAFPGGLKANVTRDGRLINLSGSPVIGLEAPAEPARLGADGAVVAARRAVGGGSTRQQADEAERVLFPTARGARLAWRTTTWVGTDAFVSVVDAETGEILWRTNLSRSDQTGTGVAVDYFPGSGVPGGGGVEHAVSFPVVDGSALSGNNAHVFADVDDNGAADAGEEIPASSGVDWNYPATLDTSTAGQNCSSTYPCTWDMNTPFSWVANMNHFGTQLYYFLNRFHDHLLAAPIGFTEAAGNFQVTNPTGQGLGGDAVEGHALLGADTAGGLPDEFHQNNAFMATFPDGTSPFMGMFLFQTVPGFDNAVSMHSGDDGAIVYHEYTHGLVGRLVTFPDGTDANVSFQAGAMNEAWADWYANDFLTNDGFIVDGPTVGDVLVGEYATGGVGIRTQGIDCTVGTGSSLCPDFGFGAGGGGYTYGDMGTVIPFPEVHEDGQIWAQTMWDVRRTLGASAAEALATRGMELSPPDPSFLDMRNAIIQADLVVNGGSNADTLWSLFAARGMGFFASSPNGADTAPIEDFSLPPDCATDPCGSVSGTITNKATGKPQKNVRVFFAGHSSGFATDLADTTDKNGTFSIADVPFHAYPEVVVDGVGFEEKTVALTVDGAETLNVAMIKDWAALEGGATIVSFTPPDYAPFCGVNADGAFDLSLGSGWPSDDPDSTFGSSTTGPRKATVELPKTIDVTSFGVASGGACGDGPAAGVREFKIQTKQAGGKWVTAFSGTADADGVLHTFKPTAGKKNVDFIRFVMLDNHGDDLFMDVLEVTVRGKT
jgi:hypothetical protein